MRYFRTLRNLVFGSVGAAILISPATMAVDYDFYSGNDVIFYDPTATSVCDTGGDINLTGNDNIEKAWNFLAGKGMKPAAIAAALGNWQQEDAGMDPTRVQGGGNSDTPPTGTSVGYGIMQWTNPNIRDVAKSAGVSGELNQLSTQLDIAWKIINGEVPIKAEWNNKSFLSNLEAMTDVNQATKYYMDEIEHPAASSANLSGRQRNARGFLTLYGGSSSSSSSSDQSSSSGGCGSGDLGYDGSKRPGQWTEADIFNGHVNYQQCDPEWGNKTYDSQGDTLCAHACGPFSMANIIQNFGYNVDPSKLALQAAKAGILTSSGSSPLPLTKYFAPQFNLRYDALPDGDVSALKSSLKNGAQVILSGRGSAPWMANVNHIISIWGYDSSTDMVNVSDPGNQSNQKAYPLSAVTAGAFAYGNRQMTNQAVAIYKN